MERKTGPRTKEPCAARTRWSMGKRTIRVRRTFTPKFKKDAVHLVVEEGKSLTEVATHLGIARSLLQRWREQLTDTPTEAFPGRGGLAPQALRVCELE